MFLSREHIIEAAMHGYLAWSSVTALVMWIGTAEAMSRALDPRL